MKHLLDTDLQKINDIVNHFKEISKPKKYVVINGGCNDYEDEMTITIIGDIDEAQQIIEDGFENEEYFGFEKVNFQNRGYWFSLIVTDDEKLNSKYRDALSYDEFSELCKKKFGKETKNHFDQVWNLETKSVQKFWKNDSYKEDGQTFYSGRYSTWRTY